MIEEILKYIETLCAQRPPLVANWRSYSNLSDIDELLTIFLPEKEYWALVAYFQLQGSFSNDFLQRAPTTLFYWTVNGPVTIRLGHKRKFTGLKLDLGNIYEDADSGFFATR